MHLNCRLMRPMFCNQRKSKGVKYSTHSWANTKKKKKWVFFSSWLEEENQLPTHFFLLPLGCSASIQLYLLPPLLSQQPSLHPLALYPQGSFCGLPLDLLSISSSLSILQYIHCHVQTISVWPLFLYLQNMQHVQSLWCPHPDPLHPGPF